MRKLSTPLLANLPGVILLPRLLWIALLLLAFGLRIHKLDAQSLWYDEGVSATVAQLDLVTLTSWTANDIQPPLYYYVLAGWGRIAGWNEWCLRFPSVFFGLLAVGWMGSLARLLGGSKREAWLVALLTALHPLFIYYSQEARMYTMLLALGVLTAYALLKAMLQGQLPPSQQLESGLFHSGVRRRSSVWWTVYVVAGSAAVYTHYFAFFLLLALTIGVLILPQRTGLASSRLRIANLYPIFLANLAIFLLYIPWFFALFRSLRSDTSYWQGEFKWWEALRHVAVTFSVGETMLEGSALQWLPLFALVTVFANFGLLRRRDWGTLLMSLIWLLIPLFCVLTLAWMNPKFNARYAMVALPGLILLWGIGIGEWRLEHRPLDDSTERTMRPSLDLFFTSFFVILLSIPFALSTQNWFDDSAFTKAQWREIAAYVKQNIQQDERVVLVSGHAAPVWYYYAPELTPIRLPEIDILDVNAVLDYQETARLLVSQLGDARGVWLVEWQDEVIDPNAMALLILAMGGSEQPVSAQFWHLHLRHYNEFDSTKLVLDLPITNHTDLDYAGYTRLLGYSQHPNGDLLLVWQRGEEKIPPGHDLLVAGVLSNVEHLPTGKLEARRPAAYDYPIARWKPGEIVIGRIPLHELIGKGVLPNSFTLALTLFDPQGDTAGMDIIDSHGQRIGKQALIEIELTHPTSGIDDPSASTWHELRPGLHVQGTLSAHVVEQGEPIWIDLAWYATSDQAAAPFIVAIGDQLETKQMVGSAREKLRLPQHQIFHQRVRLPHGQQGTQSVRIYGVASGESNVLDIGKVEIKTRVRNLEMPTLAIPLHVEYFAKADLSANAQAGTQDHAATLELAGLLEPLSSPLTVNGPLYVTVVWRAAAGLRVGAPNYVLSLQLLDESGRLAAQKDDALPGSTSTWQAGQVEIQTVQLTTPAAGSYRLMAIVYDPAQVGFPRLVDKTGADAVEIATVKVE